MKKTKKKNNLIKFITFSLLLIPIVGVAVKFNESSPGNKPIINAPVKNENVAVDYDNQTMLFFSKTEFESIKLTHIFYEQYLIIIVFVMKDQKRCVAITKLMRY